MPRVVDRYTDESRIDSVVFDVEESKFIARRTHCVAYSSPRCESSHS
jgi:hypothetical protein